MIVFSRVNENKFTVPAGFDKALLIGGDGLDVELFLTINVLGWQSIFMMLACNLNKAAKIAGIKPEQRSKYECIGRTNCTRFYSNGSDAGQQF